MSTTPTLIQLRRKPLSIRVDALPPTRTAQQKGAFICHGRIRFYTKKPIRQQEETLTGLILSRLPEGWTPFACPVRVKIHLCFPYRRTERKSVVRSGEEIPNDRRPDIDNLCKGLIDALTTAQVWRDDGQIAALSASKTWGPAGYWTVTVEPLEDWPEFDIGLKTRSVLQSIERLSGIAEEMGDGGGTDTDEWKKMFWALEELRGEVVGILGDLEAANRKEKDAK